MEIIDAHAHLFPSGLPGRTDLRTGIRFLPGGLLQQPSGERIRVMPPRYPRTAFPAETLLGLMDTCGISHAVLLANSLTDLRENARAVRAYPGSFTGAMTVPLGEAGLHAIREGYGSGLRVIKFELSAGLGYTNPGWFPDFRADSPDMLAICTLAGSLGITVTVDAGPVGGKTCCPEALDALTAACPGTRFVLCHLGFPQIPMNDPALRETWRTLLLLARRPNVWLDFAALTDLCREEAPGFPTPPKLVREAADLVGADRLLWGSDVPGALCAATFRQMLHIYLDSPLFTDEEKRMMLGGNARKAYAL